MQQPICSLCCKNITKKCLYNFDPLKPHFYIVKLGFTGVYIIFFISAQKHRLWVLVRTASASTHNLCFEPKYEKKYQIFLYENFQFLEVKFSIYLNRRVFVIRRLIRKGFNEFVMNFLRGHALLTANEFLLQLKAWKFYSFYQRCLISL